MKLENQRNFLLGDKVQDCWGKFWTIKARFDMYAPIRYSVEEKDDPICQLI